MFKNSTYIPELAKLFYLYQCCDDSIDHAIHKGHADIVDLSDQELLSIIKQPAIISILVVVELSDFLSTRQSLSETIKII